MFRSCPVEGALRDPSLTAPCHANRRGPFALSPGSPTYGSPGKTRSRSLSRLPPVIPPPASAATAARGSLFLDRYLGVLLHFARDSSRARPKQRNPGPTREQ